MKKFTYLLIVVFFYQDLAFAEPEMTEPSGPSTGFADLDEKCPINMPLLEFYKCMEAEKKKAEGDQCQMQAIRCHIKQRPDFAASRCAQIKDPEAYWQCFQNNVKDQAIAENPNINLPQLLSFIGLAATLANNGGSNAYFPSGGDRSGGETGRTGDLLPDDSTYNPYSDPNNPLYNQDVTPVGGATASSF